MSNPVFRLLSLACTLTVLTACENSLKPTSQERVGYLRELVRARAVSRDTLPIDDCSLNRFMDGVPAWRDSLVDAERASITTTAACPATTAPVRGRFVLTQWYRNWSGEYVIRGTTEPWDQGYRFTDGIFVGREKLQDQQYHTGIADRPSAPDTSTMASLLGDSVKLGGTVADTPATALPTTKDSTPRPR